MAEEVEVGCARPTGGPVGEVPDGESSDAQINAMVTKEVAPMIQVGKKAPDFMAPGYKNLN